MSLNIFQNKKLKKVAGYLDEDGFATKAELPTNVSDLNNDIGFVTKNTDGLENYYKKEETYSKDEVNSLISMIPKFQIKVVQSLPTKNISTTTLYLVKTNESGNDIFTEYIYVDNKWEKLGNQSSN